MAGFTTTCLVEMQMTGNPNLLSRYFLYSSAVVSICANLTCVSLSTIITIWGSGKALRGKEGSMDEAVDGMNKERATIFNSFAVGLAGNLLTVMATCLILMPPPMSFVAVVAVIYTAIMIAVNAQRIQRKFQLTETVQLDDLTHYPVMVQSPPVKPSVGAVSKSTGVLGHRGKNPQDSV
jgi:hypothetical protein